jgi:hypothetical protein
MYARACAQRRGMSVLKHFVTNRKSLLLLLFLTVVMSLGISSQAGAGMIDEGGGLAARSSAEWFV